MVGDGQKRSYKRSKTLPGKSETSMLSMINVPNRLQNHVHASKTKESLYIKRTYVWTFKESVQRNWQILYLKNL